MPNPVRLAAGKLPTGNPAAPALDETQRSVANHCFRDHFYVVDQFNGQLSGLITVLKS